MIDDMSFKKKDGIFEHNGRTYKKVDVDFGYFYYRYRGIGNKSKEGALKGWVLYDFGVKGSEIDFIYRSFGKHVYAYGINELDYILTE